MCHRCVLRMRRENVQPTSVIEKCVCRMCFPWRPCECGLLHDRRMHASNGDAFRMPSTMFVPPIRSTQTGCVTSVFANLSIVDLCVISPPLGWDREARCCQGFVVPDHRTSAFIEQEESGVESRFTRLDLKGVVSGCVPNHRLTFG